MKAKLYRWLNRRVKKAKLELKKLAKKDIKEGGAKNDKTISK